jgi:hypothetical protein
MLQVKHRAYPRARPRADQPIEVQIVGDGFLEMVKARDIGVGGLSVHVPHHFEGCNIHSEVQLVVKLPNQKPFLARGFIRHRAGRGVMEDFFGLEFSKLGPDDATRIEQYVSKRTVEGGAVT